VPAPVWNVNRIDRRASSTEDAVVAETDIVRLLLEGHRAASAELVSSMVERGYPDAKAAHGAVFMNIDRRSGTRLTDLARRAGMTKQGMMLIVDDLEQRGYVRRVRDAEDARAKVVRLTARGRRYVAEARRAMAALEARARRELGERRYEALRDGLELLVSGSDVTEE
jgi:DNA-binding MarR family transcriptional regulator